MQNLSFCPKCGAPLQPDFLFCTSCGFALSNLKQDSPGNVNPVPITPESNSPTGTAQQSSGQLTVNPVQNKPLAATQPNKDAPLFSPTVHAIIIAVIFAGIGFWIWSMNRPAGNKNTDTQSLFPGQDKDNNTKGDDNNNTTTITIPTRIQSEDFEGVWRAYEANNSGENETKLGNPDDDLFIEVNNGNFVMYPRNEKGKEPSVQFACGEVVVNTINCRGTSLEDKSAFSIKLEMQDSKNEMTITISPDEATEKMILKTRRL